MNSIYQNIARWDAKIKRTAWIDYRNAYDIVPQSWIIESLKEDIEHKIYREKHKETGKWKCQQEEKAYLKSKSRVVSTKEMCYHHYYLRLRWCHSTTIRLFVTNKKELEIVIQTVRIFNQDIGIEFGLEKCAMLNMISGE